MIRGALILAVGFGLGYAKALHEMDDIREDVRAMKDGWCEFFNEATKQQSSTETENNTEGE